MYHAASAPAVLCWKVPPYPLPFIFLSNSLDTSPSSLHASRVSLSPLCKPLLSGARVHPCSLYKEGTLLFTCPETVPGTRILLFDFASPYPELEPGTDMQQVFCRRQGKKRDERVLRLLLFPLYNFSFFLSNDYLSNTHTEFHCRERSKARKGMGDGSKRKNPDTKWAPKTNLYLHGGSLVVQFVGNKPTT